jgi:hypothetical protein
MVTAEAVFAEFMRRRRGRSDARTIGCYRWDNTAF